jgi:superfamily II DNA or RNA helicase
MIGRCLRPSPGKAAAVILDHVGNTLRLGHHLEPREWTLDGLAKRDRDKAPSVKVCPQCFAAMASQAKQCGECGHTFAAEVRELQQVEGELVEVAARERKQEQGSAATLDELIAIGRRRNMKNPAGWARHVMAARSLRSGKARVREVVAM